jgi:hypothetical protein
MAQITIESTKKVETPKIETRVHDAIVYSVYNYILKNQGTCFPVQTLCLRFWGKYTKSLDTAMRNIIEEISNDRMMKLIVSTREGYLHPHEWQIDVIERNMAELEKTAKALFYRRQSINYKLSHDQQRKLKIGKYDKEQYDAFVRILVEEKEAELIEQQKTRKYPEEVVQDVEVSDDGQMGFVL